MADPRADNESPSPAAAKTDIAGIGAGPVGLFCVFECGMLDLRCTVLDALDAPGGQCIALYPEKPIYDIPGYPQISAGDLVEKLLVQARPFHPVFRLGEPVTSLAATAAGFRLATAKGGAVEAGAVIIAAGVGAFGPNRPPLEDLARFEASGAVQYLVKRRDDFAGKRVVIAGGGDSAVDWALALAPAARTLAVVHRRDKFRAAPDSERRLRALAAEGKIDLVVPYQLDALEGSGGRLEAVTVKSLGGEARRIPADVLLPFYGLAQDLGPIAGFGLNVERNLIAVDPATCATSVKGVFAVGDIVTYPGKLKLILSGFAEAALAAHAVRAHLRPGEAFHFEYSTTRGVPKP
ncbi:MAG: NAD(P)/FAD-dependent oxidoreductase [Rhodospirillales bacterium]|nr:NAD(P)/FAD-dependent oxidoreductase [Rhodospirillales bacterium]